MSGQEKLHWAEIQQRWCKILFAMIFRFARFFDSSRNRRAIVGGYVEFFNGGVVRISKLSPL